MDIYIQADKLKDKLKLDDIKIILNLKEVKSFFGDDNRPTTCHALMPSSIWSGSIRDIVLPHIISIIFINGTFENNDKQIVSGFMLAQIDFNTENNNTIKLLRGINYRNIKLGVSRQRGYQKRIDDGMQLFRIGSAFKVSKTEKKIYTEQIVTTPQWLYDRLNKEFKFDHDPCPINPNFDGLASKWGRMNFVNPPFKTSLLWFKKAEREFKKHNNESVILLPYNTKSTLFYMVSKSKYVTFCKFLGTIEWPKFPALNKYPFWIVKIGPNPNINDSFIQFKL